MYLYCSDKIIIFQATKPTHNLYLNLNIENKTGVTPLLFLQFNDAQPMACFYVRKIIFIYVKIFFKFIKKNWLLIFFLKKNLNLNAIKLSPNIN